eukprot:scaffold2516_cov108-Isochrysis_galbana.AAC.12
MAAKASTAAACAATRSGQASGSAAACRSEPDARSWASAKVSRAAWGAGRYRVRIPSLKFDPRGP